MLIGQETSLPSLPSSARYPFHFGLLRFYLPTIVVLQNLPIHGKKFMPNIQSTSILLDFYQLLLNIFIALVNPSNIDLILKLYQVKTILFTSTTWHIIAPSSPFYI